MEKDIRKKLEDALLKMDRYKVESVVAEILRSESNITLFDKFIAPAMEKVGEKWERGEAALAQVYMAGRICEALAGNFSGPSEENDSSGDVLAITVLDDYHVLGKRVVSAFLRGAGYTIADYGRTRVEELVERVRAEKPSVLLISVLMLPSALEVKPVVEQIRKTDHSIKVIVGGAPFRFDKQLWREVGADAVGHNAGDAVSLVQKYLSGEDGR